MSIESIRVVSFDSALEKGKKTIVYVTRVDDGKNSWDVDIRYSRFHDFHHDLLRSDRHIMGKFPFPSKDLFSNQSPEYRQQELNKFMIELSAVFDTLTATGKSMLMELLEVHQHLNNQMAEEPVGLPSFSDIPEKRTSKQSISSTTTTELEDDNQRDSMNESHPEDYHNEPASPVNDASLSSPSTAPQVVQPSRLEVIVPTESTNAPTPNDSTHELAKGTTDTPLIQPEETNEVVHQVDEQSVDTSKNLNQVVEVKPQASSLILAVESYAPSAQGTHHVWSKATIKSPHEYVCRYLVIASIHALYPSLFI